MKTNVMFQREEQRMNQGRGVRECFCYLLGFTLLTLLLSACANRSPNDISRSGDVFIASPVKGGESSAKKLQGVLEAAAHQRLETGKPVKVQLRGGNYFLDAPLVLRPEHSQVVFAAYRNEKPVLSGGRRITGWRETNAAGKELWTADIPEVREGKWYFRELWVNGERRVRARHPNKGYFNIETNRTCFKLHV